MRIFPYLKKYPLVTSTTILVVVVAGAFGVKIGTSRALLGFGGKIISVIPCTGSDGTALVVETPPTSTNLNPFPKVYILDNATSVSYKYYQFFRPGPWILGSYVPGGVCLEGGFFGSDITEELLLISGGTQASVSGSVTGGFIGTIVTDGTSM